MNSSVHRIFFKGCKSKLEKCASAFRHARNSSTTAVELFEVERERQLSVHKRIEKISVTFNEVPGLEGIKLEMNKHNSTPYSCAKHFSEYHKNSTGLSLVNGEVWDMHKPLVEDCDVKFLTFQLDDPTLINQAYWRGCAFILGSILQRAFKPECNLLLHRPPDLPVESGSFAYDFSADLGRDTWKPTSRELLILSQMAVKLSMGVKGKQNFYFITPLQVTIDTARQIFGHNKYKLKQLDELSNEGEERVTLYKMGTHVDMHPGPLISNANLIGRYNITAVHKIGVEDERSIYRAQGVSLPAPLTAHSWTYEHLIRNATPLNTAEEIKLPEPVVDEPKEENIQSG